LIAALVPHGLVYLLAREADVGDGRSDVLFGNITFVVAMSLHLAALLRRVVLVGQATFGKRVSKCAGAPSVSLPWPLTLPMICNV
jgi:hypothetical protein